MRRAFFNIILIFCVTLWSLSSVISFIYQVNAGGSVIEICNADGLVTIFASEDEGKTNGQKKPSCPFCGIAAANGMATVTGERSVQIYFPEQHQYKSKLIYEIVLSRSFKSGLNTPLRAPPFYS